MIIGVLVGVGVVLMISSMVVLQRCIEVVAPNEVLVVAGTSNHSADGGMVGYRFARGGRALRMPLLEKAARLDVTNMVVNLELTEALTKDFIPVNIVGVAHGRIGGDPSMLERAAQLWLGTPREQLMLIIERTVAGMIREVVAGIEAGHFRADHVAIQDSIEEGARFALEHLGIELSALRIQRVTDYAGYLDALEEPGVGTPVVQAVAAAPAPAPVAAPAPTPAVTFDQPPTFLPAPMRTPMFQATAVEQDGQRVTVAITGDSLTVRPWGGLSSSDPVTTIDLGQPLVVALSSSAAADPRLQIELRQEGSRLGLTCTTRTFDLSGAQLSARDHAYPRLEESDMKRLLGGVRAAMQSIGAEVWVGD